MTKDANRARFPWLAELKDRYGDDARILWAKDEQGGLGHIPPDPPNWVTVDACNFFEMARLHEVMNPRKRK